MIDTIQWSRGIIWRTGVLLLLGAFQETNEAAQQVIDVSDPGPIQTRFSVDQPAQTDYHFVVPSGGTISDINVQFSIAYPDLFDLQLFLVSPLGTEVELYAAVEGGPNFQDTRVDDSAAGALGVTGVAPYKGPDHVGGTTYKPEFYDSGASKRLSAFNGQNPAGTWTLQVFDHYFEDTGTLYSAGQAAPWGTAFGTKLFVTTAAQVVGRSVFYNNSAFDGNNALATAADDSAIATDKSALLPGQTAAFANYTSYSKGINGIMVDISGLGGTPTASDFTFKVGNNNTPAGWATAPAPTSVSVRTGAGTGGSDRVTIIWADNAIRKQWLQVTVKANSTTGLAANDVFYFGNAVGDTGNDPANTEVTAADVLRVRSNPRQVPLNPATINLPYDFDRDKNVGAADALIARSNPTSVLNAVKLITVP